MKKTFFLIIVLIFLGFLAGNQHTSAQNLTIEGNGSGSDNQIVVGSGAVVTVTQQNSASITNDIHTSANTGGNNVTGSSPASITTGNATAVVKVNNVVNSNLIAPTSAPTPTPGPVAPSPRPTTSSPAPTAAPGDPGSSSSPSSSPAGPSDPASAVGGAQVLGLSATAGNFNLFAYLVPGLGVICLLISAAALHRGLHS